jgi:hypothetical protein
MDCTNVYHNDKLYGVLRDAGIEPIRSSGYGRYPPNSYDCMPCELVNNRLKESVRESIQQIAEKSTNNGLQHLIIKSVKNLPKDFVRNRIACLPKIMDALVEKQGGRTKDKSEFPNCLFLLFIFALFE